MRVYRQLPSSPGGARYSAAIGFFDGVHEGHAALIREAERHPAESAVFCFSNRPASYIEEMSGPRDLTGIEERLDAFEALGVSSVFMPPFDGRIRSMGAEEFVCSVLAVCGVVNVVAGFNFRFARDRAADTQDLERICAQRGISVSVVGPVRVNGELVSSSAIRRRLYAGDIPSANAMLGRPFMLTGTVTRGRRIGSSIGVPTINLAVPESRLVPKWGVYETFTRIGDEIMASVTNVGENPTVNGSGVKVETHVIDFSGDVYGRTVSVGFLSRIRGEERFASLDELKLQIDRDILTVRGLAQGRRGR